MSTMAKNAATGVNGTATAAVVATPVANGASPAANGATRKLNLFSHVKYEHMVAGISGGVTSTLILHPLDLIKIRFAVNDGSRAAPQYHGLTSAFRTIIRQEGFRGLYKGVSPNIWGSGSAWGFYFMFYNTIKTWIQGGNKQTPLGPSMHMLAAAQAGVLTLVMTNPIWVVKTRLCLQYDGPKEAVATPASSTVSAAGGATATTTTAAANANAATRYGGMVDGLQKIYKYEGVRGLYKGFVPGMFGVSHGALQFMTYEEMKNRYNDYRHMPINTKLATSEYLLFAACSKLIAAAATYPYQVIRARLQDQHTSYAGSWDCVRKTWSRESWRGFYKGLGTNLVRVTPATMITFVTYEHTASYLLARSDVVPAAK